MRKLLEVRNIYASESNWLDFAVTKVCVGSFCLLVGTMLTEKDKKAAHMIAGCMFASSATLLVKKIIDIVVGTMEAE